MTVSCRLDSAATGHLVARLPALVELPPSAVVAVGLRPVDPGPPDAHAIHVLPADPWPDPGAVDAAVGHLGDGGAPGGVVLVAWGLGQADPATWAVGSRLALAGVEPHDIVSVRGERWVSAAWPTDPLGRGHPIPEQTRVRADSGLAGPARTVATEAVAESVRREVDRLRRLDPGARRRVGLAAWAVLLDPAPGDVDHLLDADPPNREAARIAAAALVALEDVPVRDVVAARLAPDLLPTSFLDPVIASALPGCGRADDSHPTHSEIRVRRMAGLADLAPPNARAPILATTAAVHWVSGRRAAARAQAREALRADPTHRLAALVDALAWVRDAASHDTSTETPPTTPASRQGRIRPGDGVPASATP